MKGGIGNMMKQAQKMQADMQKAQEYISGFNLGEAALCLRKVAEDTAKKFLYRDYEVNPTKDFVGLAKSLREAKNKIQSEMQGNLYKNVVEKTPPEHHCYLFPDNDSDLDSITGIDIPTKGKLRTQRQRLRQILTEEHIDKLRRCKIIDEVLACTERVLNPAAHVGCSPLYKEEVEHALDLIQQLQDALPAKEAT